MVSEYCGYCLLCLGLWLSFSWDGRGFVWKTMTPSMLIMTSKKYVMSFLILFFFSFSMVKASLSAVSPSVTWDLASLPVYERPLYDFGGIPYTSLFNGATNLTNISGEAHFFPCKCCHFTDSVLKKAFRTWYISAVSPENSSWFRFGTDVDPITTNPRIVLTRNNIPLESSVENFELTIFARDATGEANVSVAAFQDVPLVPQEYPTTNASLPLNVQSYPQPDLWFTRNYPPDQFHNVGNYSSRSNVSVKIRYIQVTLTLQGAFVLVTSVQISDTAW